MTQGRYLFISSRAGGFRLGPFVNVSGWRGTTGARGGAANEERGCNRMCQEGTRQRHSKQRKGAWKVTKDVALVVFETMIDFGGYDGVARDGNVPVSGEAKIGTLDRSAVSGGHAITGKCLFDAIVAGRDVQDNGDMQAWVGEA